MERNAAAFHPIGYDYSRLFDADFLATIASGRATSLREYYRRADSFDLRYDLPRKSGMLEYMKISNDIVVVMSEFLHGFCGTTAQTTADGDWLHVQFRLAGGGREGVDTSHLIATPSGYCATIRSPQGSTIIREYDPDEPWKAVCLYMRPKAVESYFDIPPDAFADGFRWVSDPGSVPLNSDIAPITAGATRAVNDMFSCPYQGDIRRTFMRAKVLELFVAAAARFSKSPVEMQEAMRAATPSERDKVDRVIDIMNDKIEAPLSLKVLARQVGLNRTRLAEVFRECTGVTVQAYWRDVRLAHAQQLLEVQKLPVTEVAARVGYANISSLTRAFSKHYGMLPKDMRRRG